MANIYMYTLLLGHVYVVALHVVAFDSYTYNSDILSLSLSLSESSELSCSVRVSATVCRRVFTTRRCNSQISVLKSVPSAVHGTAAVKLNNARARSNFSNLRYASKRITYVSGIRETFTKPIPRDGT